MSVLIRVIVSSSVFLYSGFKICIPTAAMSSAKECVNSSQRKYANTTWKAEESHALQVCEL